MNKTKKTPKPEEREQLPLFEQGLQKGASDSAVPVVPGVDEIVCEGLAHLNRRTERTGAARFTSPRPMKARVEDGATLEDIFLVIDYCHALWWRDSKMEQFIRPKTLFGKENFPDYLVRARKWDAEGRKPLQGKLLREHGALRNVEEYSAHVRGGRP